ncbi:hypothetical protein AC1031_020095 [Aphanomyces cochlioides]|nr:hypothetical protein AC1031_020095 [Aphanomyces cochlioides]
MHHLGCGSCIDEWTFGSCEVSYRPSQRRLLDRRDGWCCKSRAYGCCRVLALKKYVVVMDRWNRTLVEKIFHPQTIPPGCTEDAMDNAAANGHLDVVRFLHEHRREGCTKDAVEKAAANGHLDVVRFLLNHRRECFEKLRGSMGEAVRNGHVDVVKYILALSLGFQASSWLIFMDEACSRGHVDVVQALCKHRGPSGYDGNVYLLKAAECGHVNVVRFFVQRNDIKHADQAARMAASNGHLTVVKFLVDQNIIQQLQQIADAAVRNGHLDIVKFLLHFNINLRWVVVNAASNGHLKIVKY